MTYSDAIEQVLLNNGYVAPLKLIYKEVWKYKDVEKINGKTPNATIQAIVQRDKRFTKIGLGVYALTNYLDKLPKLGEIKNEKEKIERKHVAVQGMLLEIGNHLKEVAETYTNDRNCVFEQKRLGALATLDSVPMFTYEHIIKDSVTFADVIWFNERNFPKKIFEVEHSTDFRDAFVKFMELQDFRTEFCCISDETRRSKFEKEKGKFAFKPIADRISFLTYEQVENDYKVALSKLYTL